MSKKSTNFAALFNRVLPSTRKMATSAESCKGVKTRDKTMARPIKETPTLYGEDARRFAYAVEHPRKVTAAEMQRMEKSYQMVKSIANFAF